MKEKIINQTIETFIDPTEVQNEFGTSDLAYFATEYLRESKLYRNLTRATLEGKVYPRQSMPVLLVEHEDCVVNTVQDENGIDLEYKLQDNKLYIIDSFEEYAVVNYTGGLDTVPQNIKMAAKLLVKDFYELSRSNALNSDANYIKMGDYTIKLETDFQIERLIKAWRSFLC